ncbi:MAG: hypothetical protein AAFY20_05900 [Cyanobacteria bacterium J06639_14]
MIFKNGYCLQLNRKQSLGWITGLLGAFAISFNSSQVHAQTQSDSIEGLSPSEQIFKQLLDVPSIYEIGIFVEVPDRNANWPLVTQASTSLFNPTMPSLWWNRDQVYDRWGGYRLIRGWTAFQSESSGAAIIDIQLDPQYWNRLEYLPQYALLNQLGTTAMSYGYQLRLYNSIALVGMYTCDFSNVPELEADPHVEIPVPDISNVECFATIAPFVQFESPAADDLFAPP